MQGLLLVDKPAGWTSFDVVNYVRRIVATSEGNKPKNVKVGHTGTLDPFATGLLILLIGKEYTRKAGELSKLDKTYEVAMHLGQTSTTGDPEGEITEVSNVTPTFEQVQAALKQFEGDIEQVPPIYSAIKVNGQRAYKLAREGKAVVMEPRLVKVYQLNLIEYAYPKVTFVATVSSGTYIRTLVEDVGKMLGTGAYASGLRRTAINDYEVNRAYDVQGSSPDELSANLQINL